MDLRLHPLLHRLGLELPLVQAPMAGVSTPELAAAVCAAGGLGSISVGASDARAAGDAIAVLRGRTDRSFNVNVFVHEKARANVARERDWIARLAPSFREFAAEPPDRLREIYTSFTGDDAMLEILIGAKPAVVSFHFGLPSSEKIRALKAAGMCLFATATNLDEAKAAAAAGVDAIVAQGYEAGGHRGVFDPNARDDRLGLIALVRIIATHVNVPAIAAGGIMDGAGIAAAIAAGAIAAQLGTAFIGCPESSADAAYRAALFSPAAEHTIVTRAISGRPARCLPNRFTELAASLGDAIPDYPIAYDAGKALHAAARATGESGYGAQWAGQGAPLARSLPATHLVETLREELSTAMRSYGTL